MVTRWATKAEIELLKAYQYIKKDSLQNAEKVRDEIIATSEAIAGNPERYPPDKYKTDNNGQYRAFTLHRYRISYKIMKDAILIVRMRHVSMNPLEY